MHQLGLRAACSLIVFVIAVVLAPAITWAQSGIENFVIHDSPRSLPDMQFKDGEGRTVNLTEFHGKVVLLNIWATWCAPCLREMPTLDRLQAQLGGPNFEVVALSIDRAGIKVVQIFYEKVGIQHLAMYIDNSGKAVHNLGISGLPTTFLIDRAGHEVGRLIGPAEWDSSEMVAFIRKQLGRASGLRTPGETSIPRIVNVGRRATCHA